MADIRNYLGDTSGARVMDYGHRPVRFYWPSRVSEKLSEMKIAADFLGFREEGSRTSIAAALIAGTCVTGEELSEGLRRWRRTVWFAEPPLEEQQVGFRWPEPIIGKLALLGESVHESGGRTNRTELTAYIVDSTGDITARALGELLGWYREATVADIIVGFENGLPLESTPVRN